MNRDAIETFFATLQAANPHPVTELEYTSVFELLAAVLLSAQATDVGVNKATRRLFPVANTPRALLDPYVRSLSLTFPILLDPDAAVAGAWRVTALPATFVIRPGGEVVGMAIGPREWNSAEVRALLESMLPPAR